MPDNGAPAAAAPVITPAASAAPAEPSAADKDILDFAAPAIGDVMGAIDGEGDLPGPGSKTTTTPPAAPAAPKPGEQPTKPAAQPTPQGDPPAKQLRQELESTKSELVTSKKELDDLKKRYEAGDPRIAEAQTQVKALEQERDSQKQKLETYERDRILQDPRIAPEIQEMDAAQAKIDQSFGRIGVKLGNDQLSSLLAQYSNLPFGKPDFAEKREAWEKDINQLLGGDGSDHKHLGRVTEYLEKTWDYWQNRREVTSKVQGDYLKRKVDADKRDYTNRHTDFSRLLTEAKTIPDDLKTTNPNHPDVVLSRIDELMKPEQVAELDKGIEDFIGLIHRGPAPRSDDEYAGQTPEQIAQSRRIEAERFDKAKAHSVKVMYNGLRAIRRIQYLADEVSRLRALVKEDQAANPDDPTKLNNGTPGVKDDLATFQKPAIPTEF